MRRIAQGDGEAFRELHQLRSQSLFRVVFRIVRDHETAEEILQETFLQVWQRARFYEPEKSQPFHWMLMLARSRAIDSIRRRQALDRREEIGALRAAPEPLLSPDLLDNRILQKRVRSALQELPAEQRDSLQLAYFHDLSHAQIADRLATPLGTVKSRIQLGLRRLRRMLAAAEPPASQARTRPDPEPVPAERRRFRDEAFAALDQLDRRFGLFSG